MNHLTLFASQAFYSDSVNTYVWMCAHQPAMFNCSQLMQPILIFTSIN